MQHHITIPISVARFILAQRAWIVLVVLAISALAVWQIRQIPLSISALESFTSDFETFEHYQQRVAKFGGDSDMLVFVASEEGDSLFTAEKLNNLRAAVRELEALPEIHRTVSLTEVANLPSSSTSVAEDVVRSVLRQQLTIGEVPQIAGAVTLKPWWPESSAEQATIDLQSVRDSMTHDSLLAGKLVSTDGSAQCMVLQLVPDEMNLRARWKLRREIIDALRRNGLGSSNDSPVTKIAVSGLAVSEGWILVELVSSLRVQLPIGALAIAVLVYGMYRSFAIAMLTILVGAIASLWAVALTGVIFGKITILVAAVPLLILVISTSDTIHIVSAFGRELARGQAREQALELVIRDLGGACILTSLTTLVGFFSLLAIPVTAIRHLAVVAGCGVALALILAVTLVPIGIAWLKFVPPEKKSPSKSLAESATMLLVAACRWAATKFPRTVIAAHFVAMIVAGYYASSIQFDPNLTERFYPKHPMPVEIQYFNNRFYGTNVIEIFVSADRERLLAPENLASYRKLGQRLTSLPEIKSVNCLNDLFEVVDRTVGYRTAAGLPPTSQAAEASLGLLSQFQPETVRALVTPAGDMIRISAFTSLSGFFDVLELSKKIDSIAQEELSDELDVDISGIMPTIAGSVETIVDSQLTSLLFCFSVVLLIIIIALRSFRLGLLALPSNIFPLLILVGWLCFHSRFVDSDYIIVFTIAFAIATDDTIHFLHRYDVELAHGANRRLAIEQAYNYSGRAIVQTTFVLGIGLLPLAMSNYLTIWMLGTYLVLTLVLSVFADLLLLPALILMWGE